MDPQMRQFSCKIHRISLASASARLVSALITQLCGQVIVTQEQRTRLKQIHWDTYKEVPEGSIWQKSKPRIDFDLDQVANLFQVGEIDWHVV